MTTVNVPDLDEAVVYWLKKRAADNNRSLENEIRDILARAAADERDAKQKAFLEMVKPLREQQIREQQRLANRKQTPSEILIREDRDSDHGRL